MIALKSPEIAILITNTNVHHNLAESEYSTRKKQCEKAAEVLGQNSLRDVTLADLKGKLFYLLQKINIFWPGSQTFFTLPQYVITCKQN